MSRASARRLLTRPLGRLAVQRLEDRTTPALFEAVTAQTVSGLDNAGSAGVGDFNSDGISDVVMTDYGTKDVGLGFPDSPGKQLIVLLGQGGGKFGGQSGVLVGNDQFLSYVRVADMNADGKPDLVCVSSGPDSAGLLTVFTGDGQGGFTKTAQVPTGGFNTFWVGIGQFTAGDKAPDVVTANFGSSDGKGGANEGSYSVFQGDGLGGVSFLGKQNGGLDSPPQTGAVGDFDGDGNDDVVFGIPGIPEEDGGAYPNGKLQYYIGNGAGGFTAGNSYSSGGVFPVHMEAADLNADGQPDLVVANAGDPDQDGLFADFGAGTSVAALLNTGGNFKAPTVLAAGLNTGGSKAAYAVAVDDYDLDGNVDIAAVVFGNVFPTAPAKVAVYAGKGNGTFLPVTGSPFGTGGLTNGQFVAIGDFDGNGTPDLVAVGLTNKVATLLNKSIPPVATATALASSANPSAFGAGVTFTATVTGAGGTPAGTVAFYDGANKISGDVPLDAAGTAVFATSGLSTTTHLITARYSGGPGFAASTSPVLNQQVQAAATSTSLSASPTSPSAGVAVTFTALVTAAGVVPAGTVSFFDGDVLIGGPVAVVASGASGKAEFVTSVLGVGGHPMKAVFTGNANFATSTSNVVTVTVTDPTPPPVTPAVTLQSSDSPSDFGQGVTFTATVSVAGGTPGGVVRFFDGAVQIGADVPLTAAAPFKAQLTTAALALGTHTITAKYGGSAGFNPADSGPLTQTVTAAATSVSVAGSVSPATVTLPVTLTATVASTTGTQVGAVQFYDGPAAISGLQPIGAGNKATFTTGGLGLGSRDITAKFVPGDANSLPSTSAVFTLPVIRGGVTVVVSSGGPAVVTQPVTLTATLAEVPGLAADPTGQVTFSSNGTVLGTATVSGGVATLTTSALPVGGSPIVARYAGDATFADATSGLFTQPVTKAGVTLTLTGSAPTLGQPATFTLTVAEVPAIDPADPTGQVIFRRGTDVLATVPVAGGVASFRTTALPIGATTVTAEYVGDANFVAGTAPGVTVAVTSAATTVSLATNGTPAVVTVPVSLTATVNAAAGTPTGAVQFFSGGTAISGLVPVAGGKATFSTAALPLGASALTAQFVPADAAFAGSTSAALTQQVNRAAPVVTVTVDGAVVAGQPSTLRAAVTRPAGVTADPGGTVTFKVNGVAVGTPALVGGVATVVTTLPAGDNTLTVEFAGDDNFAAAAGQVTAAVTPPVPPGTRPTLVGYREFGVGAGAGRPADARFFNPDGTGRFDAIGLFPGQTGGVRVTSADFNGDGVADLVAGTGPGSATRVVVLDGKSRAELFRVDPFEAAFTGGVYLATGDVTGDGVPDLAISPDEGGGPRVRVFSGKGFAQVDDFFGIEDPDFRGGARGAISDLNGDGVGELVVGAGFGGGPRVSVWDGKGLGNSRRKLYGDFFVFEQGLRNGAFVAAGDVDGDGVADLIAGGGPGGGPRVTITSGAERLAGRVTEIANFFAGDPNNRGGVRVVARDLDGDSKADLVVGAGTGAGSRVTGYRGSALAANRTEELFGFNAFDGFDGGVYVG